MNDYRPSTLPPDLKYLAVMGCTIDALCISTPPTPTSRPCSLISYRPPGLLGPPHYRLFWLYAYDPGPLTNSAGVLTAGVGPHATDSYLLALANSFSTMVLYSTIEEVYAHISATRPS